MTATIIYGEPNNPALGKLHPFNPQPDKVVIDGEVTNYIFNCEKCQALKVKMADLPRFLQIDHSETRIRFCDGYAYINLDKLYYRGDNTWTETPRDYA